MKSLFSLFTEFSLRFRAIILALVVVFVVLGVIAVTQLQQELLPSIAFPQTVILAQASGMSTDEVLEVLTRRLESALDQIEPIINIESTTTGAFGSVIIARNDFGVDQTKLQASIRSALDQVWLPQRRIEPPDGQEDAGYARALLADITPDVLIYLNEKSPGFLLQLSPNVWSALSDDTISDLLAYLAGQVKKTNEGQTALQNLVRQQLVPNLEALDVVARVTVSGGQSLPGENNQPAPAAAADPTSLLLELPAEVWRVVGSRVGLGEELDERAVETLRQASVAVPTQPPPLPSSWQRDGFHDASDLLEMENLTRSAAAVINAFAETGRIVGALGQTDDLTPEIITKMLELQPSLARYFKAEHLVAMPQAAFEALPDDFIANLDGFTRDELAAKALAASITGQDIEPKPVNLPSAWRISPPQLISFSFDDIPLASFSVASAAPDQQLAAAAAVAQREEEKPAATPAPEPRPNTDVLPEGPALPPFFSLLGLAFGVEMNSADDLINLQLPDNLAAQFGGSALRAADLLNFLMLLRDPAALPPGINLPPLLSNLDVNALIGSISPEAVAFLAANDPTFLPNLADDVFNAFSDGVLERPEVAPPLDDAWNTLANRPQFADRPLRTAADLLALGNGRASTVLNTINRAVPEAFTGYEVRLFDSLSVAAVRYLVLQEPDFLQNLETDVLTKLSPAVLSRFQEQLTSILDGDAAEAVQAIAMGERPSAAQRLAARYQRNVPEGDPTAPPLNPDWKFVGDFLSVELDTADDFFRFFPSVTAFLNNLFDSPQGIAFAPNLFGRLPVDAARYMARRDPQLFDNLRIEALQLLTPEVLQALPQSVRDRAASDGEPFVPTNSITRTNGSSSLLVTIYKKAGTNTVAAFHTVADAIRDLDARNDTIQTNVVFEQASFIEESISGVAREGGLGGIFAVIVILVFLSAGVWSGRARRATGIILIVIFLTLLAIVVGSGLEAAGGDIGRAFDQADVVVRVLLLLGAVIGLLIFLWPGTLPYPAWRSTLVVAISIPLSLCMALAVMNWVPPFVHQLLAPAAETSPLIGFLIRLFPASVTINIMTLSGLTVAIGRVVDDSIVVLENIFREIQAGGDARRAIIIGTRDVSVAIFAATVITVVVFLPLGLTGGIISEFFLPFGLAVTYALLSSFIVAITVVPVLAYLFITPEEAAAEGHREGFLERIYLPVLRWSLGKRINRGIVLGSAALSMVIGLGLFAARPTTFLPELGEPQISVSVNLPSGTKLIETNAKVKEFEAYIKSAIPEQELKTYQTIVGSGGANLQTLIGGSNRVTENIASITIAIESRDQLDRWAQTLRAEAERIFGPNYVTVSAASISEQGFGGFALVLSGDQDDLNAINQKIIDTLNAVPGLTNVSSNLQAVASAGGDNGTTTLIRIDGESALRFTGELETENTLGVTRQAIEAIRALPDLPPGLKVSQGFESQLQTEGFQSLFVAMGIAIVIVVIILVFTFGSLVHWLDIILSIAVAPVGAAVLLTLTNRVLGISAMIGLLMLIGIVVTNAVVLIDRVQANRRERAMNVRDALIEAGGRRLRPILMTALATIFALMPLAVGLSKGAIIAAELGTVVIGGLFSSTLLTLIVVPVAYMLLDPLHRRLAKLVGRGQ